MLFAAVRIASSRRSMSRSAESEAPIALSWSRRWTRSSAAVRRAPTGMRSPVVLSIEALTSLDADGAYFLHVGDAGEALLHAVLLQGAHAVFEALRQHLGDTRVLLDQLLQLVGGDQQLVQAAAALEARAAALVAADRLVEGELALVVAVVLDPLLVDAFHRTLGVGLELRRRHQLLAVFAQERGELGRLGRIALLARTHALRQTLRQDAEQRVGEVERIHAHVEQPRDRLRRGVGVQRGEHQVAGERRL